MVCSIYLETRIFWVCDLVCHQKHLLKSEFQGGKLDEPGQLQDGNPICLSPFSILSENGPVRHLLTTCSVVCVIKNSDSAVCYFGAFKVVGLWAISATDNNRHIYVTFLTKQMECCQLVYDVIFLDLFCVFWEQLAAVTSCFCHKCKEVDWFYWSMAGWACQISELKSQRSGYHARWKQNPC